MRDRPVHFAARRAAIQHRANELCRAARAACGLPSGTYLLVDEAMGESRKAPLRDGTEPNDPRFVRWAGEGRVGVQMQGGLAAEEAMAGESAWLRIERIPDPPHMTGRRRGRRARLWIRVGSDGRAPVWAVWPMTLHRPIPDGATIPRAAVSLRKVGPREEWSAELTVTLAESAAPPTRPTGAVAIDIGWRLIDGDIRVTSWCGEDGEHGELRLSARDMRGLELPSSLRAVRDDAFNAARLRLRAWLDATPDAPAWLREATATMPQWRSVGRLAALATRWGAEIPEDQRAALRTRLRAAKGDPIEAEGGWEALEAWRYHDYHLWQWESSQRSGALRHRREVYRCFAAGLARRYGEAVLERFDLRGVARRQTDPEAPAENETARANRQAVAVSELRSALANAFRGGVAKVDPAGTTHTCHACGALNDFDAAEHLSHACHVCGLIWDQDENAARNLLAIRLRERSGDAVVPGVARDGEIAGDSAQRRGSRYTRAAERKAAQKDALVAARKEVDKSAS